jgi:hypothetical protein
MGPHDGASREVVGVLPCRSGAIGQAIVTISRTSASPNYHLTGPGSAGRRRSRLAGQLERPRPGPVRPIRNCQTGTPHTPSRSAPSDPPLTECAAPSGRSPSGAICPRARWLGLTRVAMMGRPRRWSERRPSCWRPDRRPRPRRCGSRRIAHFPPLQGAQPRSRRGEAWRT